MYSIKNKIEYLRTGNIYVGISCVNLMVMSTHV
jgi:hypothetical protein